MVFSVLKWNVREGNIGVDCRNHLFLVLMIVDSVDVLCPRHWKNGGVNIWEASSENVFYHT